MELKLIPFLHFQPERQLWWKMLARPARFFNANWHEENYTVTQLLEKGYRGRPIQIMENRVYYKAYMELHYCDGTKVRKHYNTYIEADGAARNEAMRGIKVQYRHEG